MLEYGVFGIAAVYLFAMDLWLNRGQEMTLSRATSWSVMYVVVALLFALFIWDHRGLTDAQLFLTAYVLEKALSIDNLMVFSIVFTYFGIRPQHRHRILRWGIVGAAAMRLLFVYVGTGLFASAEAWFSGVFGFLIAYAAIKMLMGAEQELDLDGKWYVRLLKKMRPLYTGPGADAQFVIECINLPDPRDPPTFKKVKYGAQMCFTPALLCLGAIEITDLIFAVDSVPVVIAVARDPFIVYTAMMFAVMGLRSMYFILEAMQRMLRFVGPAVGVVLLFVAAKLEVSAFYGPLISPAASLGVVGAILGTGVVASLVWPGKVHEAA